MNKPLLILLILINGFAFAQNLVPNPSFEDTVYCPVGTNNPQALATWFNPTIASPDYYNTCAVNGGGVPSNDWGYQEAQDGNAYVGIITYSSEIISNYREYLEVPLTESLLAGNEYFWCFYVSLLDGADLASNNLGVSLAVDTIQNSLGNTVLNVPEHSSSYEIISDSLNWVQLFGNFKANGGEKFLIIGNFQNDLNTDTLEVRENGIGGHLAYYYIDNVYLGQNACIEPIIDMPNVFTPNNDGVNDVLTFKKVQGVYNFSISILNRWGNRVYFGENEFQWNGNNQNGELVSEGTYFYVLEYNNSKVKNGFVQVIR